MLFILYRLGVFGLFLGLATLSAIHLFRKELGLSDTDACLSFLWSGYYPDTPNQLERRHHP